jgi:hypothetical protein
MLGLNGGELSLVALLIFAVVSARFWPAAGAAIALRLFGQGAGQEPAGEPGVKSERTKGTDST